MRGNVSSPIPAIPQVTCIQTAKNKKMSKLYFRTKYAFFLEVEQFAPVMVDFPASHASQADHKKKNIRGIVWSFPKDPLQNVDHASWWFQPT